MKHLLFIALLPCILAAEIKNAVCADGTQCSEGKYCCDTGCCDTTKELQDEGYVPALPPVSLLNESVSMAAPKTQKSMCPGTECGTYCIPADYTCCPNVMYSCPHSAKCCSNSYDEQPWCCPPLSRCSIIKYRCTNGAVTTSAAMISMLFAFMIGVTSKTFL